MTLLLLIIIINNKFITTRVRHRVCVCVCEVCPRYKFGYIIKYHIIVNDLDLLYNPRMELSVPDADRNVIWSFTTLELNFMFHKKSVEMNGVQYIMSSDACNM